MALNWLDTALSVGADAVDWNEKKQQEQLEIRFKELQDNKELYRALATTRYSKDLDKYYKETEQYDLLKSAYSKIETGNLTKDQAAYEIIMATPSLKDAYMNAGTGKYGDDRKDEILNSVMANFKDKAGVTGSPHMAGKRKSENWYEFSHPEMKLTSPKQEDYFQDPKYWGNLAEEIKSGTRGPLQNQILKLMGKEPAEIDLEQLEQKAGTDIKKEISNKVYRSSNMEKSKVGQADTIYGGILLPQFNSEMTGVVSGGGLDKDVFKYKLNEKNTKVESEKIYQSAILNVLNTMDKDWIKNNTEWNEDTKMWDIDQSGSLVYGQMEELWNDLSQKMFNDTFYQGGTGKTDDYTFAKVKRNFKREISKRKITGLDNTALWGGGSVEGSLILNVESLPLGFSLEKEEKELLVEKLNEYMKSGEFLDIVGKEGGITSDGVEELIQKKANEILFPEKSTKIEKEELPKIKNLTLANVIDISKSPGNVAKGLTLEEIIEDLKKGNATFKEGVIEELLSMILTEEDMTFTVVDDHTTPLAQKWLEEHWHLMPKKLREKYPLITKEE